MKLKRGFCFNITVSKIGQTVKNSTHFQRKAIFRDQISWDLSITDIWKASINSMMELYTMHFRPRSKPIVWACDQNQINGATRSLNNLFWNKDRPCFGIYRNKILYQQKYHHICQIVYDISMTRGDFAKLCAISFSAQRKLSVFYPLTGPYRFLYFANCALNAPSNQPSIIIP